MTIRKVVYIATVPLLLLSCNFKAQEQSGDNTKTEILKDKELVSFYRKDSSMIHVLRAVETVKDSIGLYLCDVDIKGSVQHFISLEMLSRQQFAEKEIELKKIYTWTPYKGEEVLFVQIPPTGDNDFGLLDKRQDLESKIGEELESQSIGEWIAGDLGPGGANMLFAVQDIDRSLGIILTILKQNEVDNVRIGKRTKIAADDWFYTVIYPSKFSGNFNTM